MPTTVQSKPSSRGIVATLGGFKLPLELDRMDLLGRNGKRPFVFRFAFRDIPFSCTAEQQDGHTVLALTGDLGALPYTAEAPARRRAVQMILSAAHRHSGL